jgi:hypothetical protein
MKNTYKIAAIALAIVFSLSACNTEDPAREWTKVTGWDQINGAWLGTGILSKTVLQYRGINPESDIDDDEVKLFGTGARIAVNFLEILEVRLADDLLDGQQRRTYMFSGGNVNADWDDIKEEVLYEWLGYPPDDPDEPKMLECVYDDEEHSATPYSAPYIVKISEIGFNGQFPNGLEINRSKTQLREPGNGDSNPEMIYTPFTPED